MSEAIYDEQVAPLLKQVGDLCLQHGFSFAAACEYAPGDTGLTFTTTIDPDKTGATMVLADLGVRARGNFDALVMGVMRYARKHGHDSIFLRQLGVPTTPAKGDPT